MTNPPSTSKNKKTAKKPEQQSTIVDSNTDENDSMPTFTASVEVPMSKLRHGYEPRRVDVQSLTRLQRENLNRGLNGLVAQGAKLENGKVVIRQQDAIKWMLENLSPSKDQKTISK